MGLLEKEGNGREGKEGKLDFRNNINAEKYTSLCKNAEKYKIHYSKLENF